MENISFFLVECEKSVQLVKKMGTELYLEEEFNYDSDSQYSHLTIKASNSNGSLISLYDEEKDLWVLMSLQEETVAPG